MAWFGDEVRFNIDELNSKGLETEIKSISQTLEGLAIKAGYTKTQDILTEMQRTLHMKKEAIQTVDVKKWQ